jgi:hypothetical protein
MRRRGRKQRDHPSRYAGGNRGETIPLLGLVGVPLIREEVYRERGQDADEQRHGTGPIIRAYRRPRPLIRRRIRSQPLRDDEQRREGKPEVADHLAMTVVGEIVRTVARCARRAQRLSFPPVGFDLRTFLDLLDWRPFDDLL